MGRWLYNEPALKATYADGNRDVVLHFVQQHIDGDTLEIELKDIASALRGSSLLPGLCAGWHSAEVVAHRQPNRPGHHPGERTIGRLELAAGGRLRLALHDRSLVSGVAAPFRAAANWNPRHREPPRQYLAPGESVVCHRPAEQTTEESGPVWFGALGWSGSWRITVEQTAMQQLRVTGGFNPFDFGYRLNPGEQLETPPFYAGFTDGGMGEAVAPPASV